MNAKWGHIINEVMHKQELHNSKTQNEDSINSTPFSHCLPSSFFALALPRVMKQQYKCLLDGASFDVKSSVSGLEDDEPHEHGLPLFLSQIGEDYW